MAKVKHKRPLALPASTSKTVSAEPISITAKPKVSWVTVTPDLATKWLENDNTKNRKVREDHVARLAADMKNGKWKGQNGEAIRFDTAGRLVDGQHRLWACVQSCANFDTMLMTNIDPDAYATIGIGRPKSFADFIGPMDGEKNVVLLAATVRLVYFWANGLLPQMKNGSIFPTIEQLRKTLDEHPNVRDSVNAVCGMNKLKRMMSPSYACLIHYAGTLENKSATVMSFLERLGTGLGLTATDPVYHLRKFCDSQRGIRPGQRRAGQLYVLALAIKAWNASKTETSVKSLQFRINEDFPQL